MKIKLEKPELVLLLKAALEEVEKLCVVYDSGNKAVITDIAKAVIRIFQNGAESKSLLAQLKLIHLPVLCSAETYNSKSLINFLALLKLEHKPETGWNYFSKLNNAELKPVSQENWWQHKKIIIDSKGNSYSRAKIVKLVSDSALVLLDTSGWQIKDGKGNKVIINPIPETIRQVAFELIQSFNKIDIDQESKLHYKM
ncbi:hypothetical protein [Pedobacter nototheniae]|uniref:hypothetical protein n=1 Tax=Pedobacter nototheniae TaxID=2488994 RepID=UPI00292DC48D|nr:hypothetical protein [Pedobacter nototheniae]